MLVIWVSLSETVEGLKMPFWVDLHDPGTNVLDREHMGVSWQICLNDPCSAALQTVTAIVVATCYY